MTESDARIKIAKSINIILTSIYKNTSNNGFDPLIDLSMVPSTTLKDFWLYTSGFLGLKNQEDFDKMLSDKEVLDILSGNFRLIDLPLDQAQEFARQAKKKVPDKGTEKVIDLYSIQDGTYSIKKGFKNEDGSIYNCLALKTDPLEYHTDKKINEVNVTPREALKALRNVFAHRTPFVKGKKLVFERGDDEIIVSKMWLRGYSELFLRKSKTLDSSIIEKTIIEQMQNENNLITNKQELDSVLSSVKHLFGEDINQNFYKLSNFVQSRLSVIDKFYQKPMQEKAKIIASVLANNYEYITTNHGSINPSIIYNLQQLVGLELYARGEITDLSLEDYDIKAMRNIVDQVFAFNTRTNMTKTLIMSRKTFSKSAKQKYIRDLGSLKSKVRSYLTKLEDKQKLETANMDLYNLEDLNHLSVEIAFNTVLLMCFNNLVTSSFYDDLISKTDTTKFNQQQEEFFENFDVSSLKFFYNGKQRHSHAPYQKSYLLLCLREALCHGQVSYMLPTAKKGEKLSFNDAIICFKTTERQNAEIYGSIQDFFEFFSSPQFTLDRREEIVTNKPKVYSEEEIEISAVDAMNFRNLNSIVQELRQLDQDFKDLQ